MLTAEPSSAWIEKVGVTKLPSCANRTWPAFTSADVNVVVSTQVTPSFVLWNVPWLTLLTVNVKLELSGSVTRTLALNGTVPP